MIRGKRPQQSGFTIVEVVVFMSVSIALVASAIGLFSTRIPRTQFTQAVNELDIKLKGVGNDVLNGYYANSGNISCNAGGDIQNTAPTEQGTNAGCIFLGRAVQFGVFGDQCQFGGNIEECDEFRIYTVYGRRSTGTGSSVTNLADAQPKITNIGAERYTTGFGLHVTQVLAAGNGVAYLSTFGSGASGLLADESAPSGAAQVELRALSLGGGGLGVAEESFATNTDLVGAGLSAVTNPQSGVTLCLRSGASNQFAILTLGEAGRPLSNRTEILSELEWNNRGCTS
jgi:type II secretory pathway pseudopilin PulG